MFETFFLNTRRLLYVYLIMVYGLIRFEVVSLYMF